MKKSNKVLLLVIIFTFVAFSNSAFAYEPVYGGTFYHWIYWEAPLANPVLASGTFAHSFLFDPLVQVDIDGTIQPRLAESWDISEDGLEYIFHLRENVKWHDGAPFTARDVKFTYDAIMDPSTVTTQRGTFLIGTDVIKCEVIDDFTVKFSLPAAFSPFLGRLGNGWSAFRIIPEHLFAGTNIAENPYNFEPVGTGPFKQTTRVEGSHAILSRNEDYFLPVYLDRVILRIIPSAEVNVLTFENQEIYNTYLYDADVERFADYPGVKQYRTPSGAVAYFYLNVQKPLFAERDVRIALAHAIDREDIANTVTYGLAPASNNIYAKEGPHAWVYNDNVPSYEYDPEKAIAILRDLGWEPGSDGVLVRDGERFEFTHYGQTGFAQYEKVNVMLQADLAEIGVKMNIRLLEPAAFRELLLAPNDPKAMDSHLTGSGAPVFDPDHFDQFHSSQYPQGYNTYGYYNPLADELLELGRKVTDRDERREIYMELQEVIMTDLPYIPLYELINVYGVWEWVGGIPDDLSMNVGDMIWYFPERLFIIPELR